MNEGLRNRQFQYDDPLNVFSTQLKYNIYKFSAAKSLTEMIHFRNLMADENGKLLSYDNFRSRVANEGRVFNNKYLQSEYNVAKMSALNGAKFNEIQSEFLEFRSVNDNRVRQSHKALDKLTLPKDSPTWRRLTPPLDWNCRCTIVPGKESLVKLDETEAGKMVKSIVTDPLFENNPGESRVIFKDGHPYFKAFESAKETQLSYEQYGLDGLDKIVMRSDLPNWKEKTLNEYYDWWNENKNHANGIEIVDVNGNAILFKDKFKVHINDEEPRYKYGSELKNVVQNADEIWLYQDPKNKKVNQIFIRFYEPYELGKSTGAIVVVARNGEGLSLYEITSENRLKELRRGILEYSKK